MIYTDYTVFVLLDRALTYFQNKQLSNHMCNVAIYICF